MKIYCPACNSEIKAEDINLGEKVAKCGGCNNVFNFAEQISVSNLSSQERSSMIKPKNFQIKRSAYGLEIVRKWFTPAIIALTFFALFWNGFMSVWFYIAFTKKAYIMALFGSLHVVVGLSVLYAVLCGYFNKTHINISNGKIVIKHRPLPWFGQKNVLSRDLKQLYCKELIHSTKNGYSKSYSVQAITKEGKVIPLVSDLPSIEESLFIEQEIEKYLKMEDEPVRGEIPR